MNVNLKTGTKEFRANGKLFISGEYTVLDGGLAFAIPTKLGQTLSVAFDEENSKDLSLIWEAYLHDGSLWFSALFSMRDLGIISTTNSSLAHKLQTVLKAAETLNPLFFKEKTQSLICKTKLEFPKEWGLGSSSSLIYLVAKFTCVDEFDLSDLTFKTSGYDIACAGNNGPILYQKVANRRKIERIDFHPEFLDQLYFLYLNRKQDTEMGVKKYYRKREKDENLIRKISEITLKIIKAKNLAQFEEFMVQHENVLSDFLELPKVKDVYFSDYQGEIKSLGAWGGDFVLFTARPDFHLYFKRKGFVTLFSFRDLLQNL